MKIELKHIQKKFPDATPLADVNAVIENGDIVAVIGPSGTGKSTLLRCINMLDPPTAGQVLVDGLEITKNRENFEQVRQRIGMVFQSFNLFNHLTAVENVMLALTNLRHMSRQEAYDVAIEQLCKVGLAEKALKYPDELSGGQRQRVSIARTLAMDPDLILLDEPTSALDPSMVREVESVICKLAKTGKTMMIVTHEMHLARAISNRVFYLDKGILYEEGTPDEIFNHPKRERTRAFVENLKVFRYKFRTDNFDSAEYEKALSEYLENNELDAPVKECLHRAARLIETDFVPAHMTDGLVVSVIAEFNPGTGKATLVIFHSNGETDVTGEITGLLRPMFSHISTDQIEDKDFRFKTTCVI